MKPHAFRSSLSAAVWLLALTMTSGCGQQAFLAGTSATQSSQPGALSIAPKVDILFMMTDTGAAFEPQSSLRSQAQSFLSTLDSEGWDYHFTTSGLTNVNVNAQPNVVITPTQQVTASRQDLNWLNLPQGWLPPYPGANQAGSIPDKVNPSYFVTPNNFSQFPTPQTPSGSEPGLRATVAALTSGVQGSNFLRSDALLAVIFVSNGDDTSENWRGMTPSQQQTVIQNYANQLAALKGGDVSQVRAYAAVSQEQQYSGGCLNANSYIGTKYNAIAGVLGGTQIDLCQTGIAGALSSVASSLQVISENLISRYVFMDSQPDPTTIAVTITRADGSTQAIAQDPSNGWTYENGTEANPQAAVTRPTLQSPDGSLQLNYRTGYCIRLNGSAVLSGSDSANITYTQYGLHNSP